MAKTSASIGTMVESAQNANMIHDWPEEMGSYDDETWSIFAKNQCVRAHDDWNASDIMELARVSKMQSMVATEMEKLDDEGLLVMGGKHGTTLIENPRLRAISTGTSIITTTMRRLGITSMSVADKRSKANRGKLERGIEGVLDGADKASGVALM